MDVNAMREDEDYCDIDAEEEEEEVPGELCARKRYLCEHPDCTKLPSFRHPGGKVTRCSKHAEQGMVSRIARCDHPDGCAKSASYRTPGAGRVHRCAEHKAPGMVSCWAKCECCDKLPSLGFPGTGRATRCSRHKEPGMVRVGERLCDHLDGCGKRARFGHLRLMADDESDDEDDSADDEDEDEDDRSGTGARRGPCRVVASRCEAHREPGMAPAFRACDHPSGCIKVPTFRSPQGPGRRATRCGEHKEVGMVAASCGCDHPGGCSKHATFVAPGGDRATRCAEHKVDGSVPAAGRCGFVGCVKFASWEVPGGKKVRYKDMRCAEHKVGGMVRVKGRRCDHPSGCGSVPSFGEPGCAGDDHEHEHEHEQTPTPTRCAKHKTPGMVNVVHRRCGAPLPDGSGCQKHPSYGTPGDRATRCAGHKTQGMVLRAAGRCIGGSSDGGGDVGCAKPARFRLPGTKKATHCIDHRQPGMAEVGIKLCCVDGCARRAGFGHPPRPVSRNHVGAMNSKRSLATHCSDHRRPGMVNVLAARCDHPDGCDTTPSYGLPGASKKTRCATHRDPGMVAKEAKNANKKARV